MNLNETIQQELMGAGEGTEKTPIKININGNNLEFDSLESLNSNLNEALSSVGSEYKQMKQRLEELEAQASRGQVVEDDTPVDTGKFSQEKFISLLKDNPVEAFICSANC